MRSNCILWAFALWRRRVRKGREGYMAWRWSRWRRRVPFPHALYEEVRPSGSLRRVGYVPLEPRPRWLPPLLFRGKVRWGDRR